MTSTPGPRDHVALRPPAADLTSYPRRLVRAGLRWYREHGALGPWYFASGPGGRFNLEAPRGTLYLANRPECAARERVGLDQARTGWVPAGLVDHRFVSELVLPVDVSAAHLTTGAALNWGVVANELIAIDDYDLTRTWACAFDDAGFGGIWARLRFSAAHGRGLSIFGHEGTRTWSTDPDRRPLADVVRDDLKVTIVPPPHSTSLTILDP